VTAKLAILLAAALLLAGCGARLAGRSDARPDRDPAREPGLEERLRQARAESQAAPREPYWPCRLAQLYLDADSVAKAEEALEAALARDRLYAPALSLLSKLHYRAGRHEQAVAVLEAARSTAGAFPAGPPVELLAGLALHYEALGRLDLARGVLAAIPREARGEAGGIAAYLALRASPDSALALARASARARPRSAASQNNYGIALLRAGDPAAAGRAFRAAIELDPELAGPYYNLAILERYYLLDDQAALRWFELYWQRSHDDPDGLAPAFGKTAPGELAKKGE
jgi:tetratricopeptide (TPR) repeat protein